VTELEKCRSEAKEPVFPPDKPEGVSSPQQSAKPTAEVAAPLVVVEPAMVEPAMVEPAMVEPAMVEPAVVEPQLAPVQPQVQVTDPPAYTKPAGRPSLVEEPTTEFDLSAGKQQSRRPEPLQNPAPERNLVAAPSSSPLPADNQAVDQAASAIDRLLAILSPDSVQPQERPVNQQADTQGARVQSAVVAQNISAAARVLQTDPLQVQADDSLYASSIDSIDSLMEVPEGEYSKADTVLSVSPRVRSVKEFFAGAPTTVLYKTCPECGASFSHDSDICDEDDVLLVTTELSPTIVMAFFDRYQILSVVGSGGMSVVYHAVHKMLDRPVAIKLMDQGLVRNTAAVRRFQREAQMVSRLNHPNVVTMHDFGITNEGQPYMVMDFVAGETLAETLYKTPSLSQLRAKRISLQCASGLGQAHRLGIVHRDVKPGNIILDKDQSGDDLVKIVDFGIAKVWAESADASLTMAGEFFGTTAYMSPEQCRGQKVDQRSDVFSLGCVIFEMLSGQPPFEGKTEFDTLQMIVSAATPSVRDRRPDVSVPFEFEWIINKALEKDPDNRYQSMDELIMDLVKVPV
jgi:hypothetical protein